jgi:hypothetical protein
MARMRRSMLLRGVSVYCTLHFTSFEIVTRAWCGSGACKLDLLTYMYGLQPP